MPGDMGSAIGKLASLLGEINGSGDLGDEAQALVHKAISALDELAGIHAGSGTAAAPAVDAAPISADDGSDAMTAGDKEATGDAA